MTFGLYLVVLALTALPVLAVVGVVSRFPDLGQLREVSVWGMVGVLAGIVVVLDIGPRVLDLSAFAYLGDRVRRAGPWRWTLQGVVVAALLLVTTGLYQAVFVHLWGALLAAVLTVAADIAFTMLVDWWTRRGGALSAV